MFGANDAMDQPTFADLEYDGKKRKTRREMFLERMDSLIPWDQLEERIRPFYPKAGRGRRPYELSAMLRIHCVQLFYNLSDPGMEDILYEVESVRRFVGLRLSGPLPDETTILNFRHLLEDHELGQSLFEEINRHLESQGLRLREGTIVDASIIEAPSSTKNRAGDRDPEMHQTKKGNEWHFGPNPPKDTDGRREDRGRGGVRELQGGWPGLHWGRWEVSGRSSAAAQGPYGRLRELGCAGWRENMQQGTLADRDDASLRGRWVSCRLAVRLGVEWLAAGPRRD